MSLVAGVDIGNATTEIVIVEAASGRPVAWDRARTRGRKGSAEASHAAGRLLNRLQARLGTPVATAILTHQTPVITRRLDLPALPVATGRLRLVASPSATPGGSGFGVGRPVDVATPLADIAASPAVASGESDPVIAVSRDPLGYLQTVAALQAWRTAGIEVRGVLLAGDEGSLVARRLGDDLPIVDGANAEDALRAVLLAIEVAQPGRTCREVTDPLRLIASLRLDLHEHAHASAISASVAGQRSAAVALLADLVDLADLAVDADRNAQMQAARMQMSGMKVAFADGTNLALTDAVAAIEAGHPGVLGLLNAGTDAGIATDLDADAVMTPVSDLWLVDPTALASIPGLRHPQAMMTRVALSTIEQQAALDDHLEGMRSAWAGEVRIVGDEASAALRGALSTPGVSADALVVDLGGGTIDLVHSSASRWTGAGSGDLMTMATAIVTDASQAAAEWVKRGPAWRIETPHLAIDESGDRRFLDTPATHGSVGWLVTGGPSGDLPFTRSLTCGEWRTMRLALKEQVFGRNARRGLRHLARIDARDIVLVGGPAGDDEIVEAMHGTLQAAMPGASIGRADVAGVLGHRWAVAYGLVLMSDQVDH